MNGPFETGSLTVDCMSRLQISGNVIPVSWYKTIRKPTGKPNLNATYFIRLNIGVNAVAHSCNMASLPSKRDEVGFVVTRINDKFEVAEGIITRMIKRGA